MYKLASFKGRSASIILTVLIFVTAVISFRPVNAAIIKDLEKGSSYAREAIEELARLDIIEGNSQGEFKPQKTITRAEMTKLVLGILDIDITETSETLPFKDVPKNHWAYAYIAAAYKNKIVEGVSNDRFDLNAPSTREQMTAMLVRALGLDAKVLRIRQTHDNLARYKDADEISHWAKEYIEFALKNGLIKGTSPDRFTPKDGARREQAAVLAYRFFNNKSGIKAVADGMANFNRNNFPELHEVLINNEGTEFKGEYNADISIETKINGTNESVKIEMTGSGAVNGQNAASRFEIAATSQDKQETVSGYEMVKVGDRYYVKSFDETWWTSMDEDKIVEQYYLNVNEQVISGSGALLLENFDRLLIKKEGQTAVNGEKTAKYSISKGL